jgi:tetratricopeptide (TPR) repeat protein
MAEPTTVPAAGGAPETLGPWRTERELGRGGMAVVYAARGPGGVPAAVKWLVRPTPVRRARFAEEGRFLARMSHPNVAQMLGQGEEAGRPWLALELVAGPDLRLYAEKLRNRPPTERLARVRGIARDLTRALAYLHAEGVAHRDVKPGNVLLAEDGRAVLTDFGVAFAVDEEDPGAASAAWIGTAAYGAPEQFSGGPVDARVDQYGLGCTLYHLLTGRRPFAGEDPASLVRAHLEELPRPPSQVDPTVPPDLERVVMRLLEKDPAARYPDMASVEAAIGAGDADTMPFAGRQTHVDAVARAVERLAEGAGSVLVLQGARASGRHWLQALARDAAARRDLACVATDDAAEASAVAERVAAGETILLVTTVPVAGAEVLELAPLGLADVRRTLFALAPATQELARVSERLHRESGGNAGLLLACAQACSPSDGAARLELPGTLRVDTAPWLHDLDLDARDVGGVLALATGPLRVEDLEALAHTPARAALDALALRGVARATEAGWMLAAEVFRAPLRAGVPDPEAVLRALEALRPPAQDGPDPVLVEVARLRASGRAREAVPGLEAAVDGCEDASLRASRLLALGALRWSIGEPSAARAAFLAALPSLAGASARSRAAAGAGAAALQDGDLPGALDLLVVARTEAEIAGDAARQVLALVNLAEARALSGALGEALRVARRAVALAEGIQDRAIECAAVRHLGQVLLDAGQFAEAARRLADASALARASEVADERLAAHVLRAACSLRETAGAAAALDRLSPWLGRAPLDAEGFLPRGRAMWVRAAVGLGDVRMRERALDVAVTGLSDRRAHVRVRVAIELAFAARALGAREQARAWAGEAHAEATACGFGLLVAQAAPLCAWAEGRAAPPPPEDHGLDDSARDAYVASLRVG